MTLPKAPPVRRHHLPPPAPRRGAAHHVRRIVQRHEEEERPFEPTRAPTWRGSSKDLVVNPGGFERDLEALVHDYYPKLDTELSEEELLKELLSAFRLRNTDAALKRANELLDGHGVEALGGVNSVDGPAYLYINFGDTYDPTIMYSRDDDKVFVAMGGWGDVWSEEGEPNQFKEGWDSWLGDDFKQKVMDRLEGADESARERAEEIFSDDDTGIELFQRALGRAQGAGGKYPETSFESDGSLYVHHLEEIVRQAGDMIEEGWKPGTWEGHRKNGSVQADATDLAQPLPSSARVLLDIDGDPVTLDLRRGETPVVVIENFLARFARADGEATMRRVRPFGKGYTHRFSWFRGGKLHEAPLGVKLSLR